MSLSTKKIILVTGGSSGLGLAMAGMLAQAGHRVYATSRRPPVISASDDHLRWLALDVSDDDSATQCIATLIGVEGRIDVLINNAGVGLCGAIEDTLIAEARWQLETNFFGAVRMMNAVLPHMRTQGQGRIITVSSLAGLAALPYQGFYSASKFALEGLNEALRMELSGSGIDCTTIAPGDFNTGFTAARVYASAARTGIRSAQLAKTVAIYERDENDGPDPQLVARLAAKLVEAERIDVRYTVGRFDQRAGIFLKRFLPARVFESVMKRFYAIPS
jgi:NAD(P)-dependent dehydrogenase (short-subunit alcohol dehydrogenase family)